MTRMSTTPRLSEPEENLAALLRWEKLPEPVRELRWHPRRKWRWDFAWTAFQLVAVEVEGGSWVAGRHSQGAGFEADCEKYNEAQLLGWKVLRVTPKMIDDGRAIELIKRALA